MKVSGRQVFEDLLQGRSVAGFHFPHADLERLKLDPRFNTLTRDQLRLLVNLADPPVREVSTTEVTKVKHVTYKEFQEIAKSKMRHAAAGFTSVPTEPAPIWYHREVWELDGEFYQVDGPVDSDRAARIR